MATNNKLQNSSRLTKKQRAFVDCFEGRGDVAVTAAGYKNKKPASKAWQLLNKPKVQRAIAEKYARTQTEFDIVREEHRLRVKELEKIKKQLAEVDAEVLKGHVATKRERQVFWTQTMLNEEEQMSNRLKASEILGRSESDFIERGELNLGYKFGVISSPDVRMMIEEITGIRIQNERTTPKSLEIIDPESATIDIKPCVDPEPEPEESPEPTTEEVVEWVSGLKENG